MHEVILANTDGRVPDILININNISAKSGNLFYFFGNSFEISGYLNSVNPFDQEDVKSYKKIIIPYNLKEFVFFK